MHPRNTGHKTASVVGCGGGGEGRQAGADGGVGSEAGSGGGEGGVKKGRKKRRKIIMYTNNICTYFVIQVATSPCTAEKPEVDYQGAALQHLLHKVKKLKTQK